MTKNNLKLLDMDEKFRKSLEQMYSHMLEACQILGVTLDLATSDVVLYIENSRGESICIGEA